MVNYNNSIIYKLCCKDVNVSEIYVGSTTNYNRRKQEHKSNCNNPNVAQYNHYKYQFIRDHGNWDNWDMIVIEEVNCSSKRQLETIERNYIEELQAELNKYIPTRSIKERYEDNKEKRLEYKKQYREDNKEKIAEQQKKYREENKKEKAEYQKKYREENKKEILEKQKKQIMCDCGIIGTIYHLPRHKRTLKHTKRMNAIRIIQNFFKKIKK